MRLAPVGGELIAMTPVEKRVYVYRQEGPVTEIPYWSHIDGGDVAPGFIVCPAEVDPG